MSILPWKITAVTPENRSSKSSLELFDKICEQKKSCNKVLKFLGICSPYRLYTDWCIEALEEKIKKKTKTKTKKKKQKK